MGERIPRELVLKKLRNTPACSWLQRWNKSSDPVEVLAIVEGCEATDDSDDEDTASEED